MIASSGFLAALAGAQPAGGAYSAPPHPLTGLRETLLLRGRGGEVEGEKGRRGEGRGGEMKRGKGG